MNQITLAAGAWAYAMAVYFAGVNFGTAAGWALFFSGSLAVIVFVALKAFDDRPDQVERLEARDQSEALEACRQVLKSLRPLLRHQIEGTPTTISITIHSDPCADVRLDDLRRALDAVGVKP